MLESSRVRVIGVDGKIGPLLKQEAQKLVSQGLITNSVYNKFNYVAYEVTNTQKGWYHFHHHHMHLSSLTNPYPQPILPEPEGPFVEPAPASSIEPLPIEKIHPISCDASGACKELSLKAANIPALDLASHAASHAAEASRPVVKVLQAAKPIR